MPCRGPCGDSFSLVPLELVGYLQTAADWREHVRESVQHPNRKHAEQQVVFPCVHVLVTAGGMTRHRRKREPTIMKTANCAKKINVFSRLATSCNKKNRRTRRENWRSFTYAAEIEEEEDEEEDEEEEEEDEDEEEEKGGGRRRGESARMIYYRDDATGSP